MSCGAAERWWQSSDIVSHRRPGGAGYCGSVTPALRPAPAPREINTTRVAMTGTALALLGLVVLLFFLPELRRAGAMVWLWSFVAAFLVGLWGLAIMVWQQKTRPPRTGPDRPRPD